MIKINGTIYNVGILNLQRQHRKDYKYDVTTEDGIRHTETRAIYPVYAVTFGSLNQNEYDALRAALNTYDEAVQVELPDGQDMITVMASVDINADAISFIESDGTIRWDGMTATFTGLEPLERG